MLESVEVAERLGVSVRSVQNWCKNGLLKSYKFGRKYKIAESDLKEFIEESKQRGFDIENPNYNMNVEE